MMSISFHKILVMFVDMLEHLRYSCDNVKMLKKGGIMKKDISKYLKEYRNKANISVKEISRILTSQGFKASESTIYSCETGNSQPTPDALMSMCEVYGIKDVLKAFGYDGYNEDGTLSLNMYEIDIIEKYRTLDNYGQKIINLILDEEVERCTPSEPLLEPISIAYYHQLASAGQGEYIKRRRLAVNTENA